MPGATAARERRLPWARCRSGAGESVAGSLADGELDADDAYGKGEPKKA